jgi:ketosteroid isomerase-like protein
MLRSTRTVFPRQTGIPVVLLMVATACRSAGADVDAVKAQIAREVQAMNSHDLQALSEIWSQVPDITLFDIAPPGRFQGWQGIARTFGEFFERVAEVRMTVDHVDVRVEGTLAYATYDWAMTGKMGEASLDDSGQATAIYRREKDGWRLVHAHYSATLAPPPAPVTPPPSGGQHGPAGAKPADKQERG